MEIVTHWPLKTDYPFCSITGDRNVTSMYVAMQMSLVRQQRGRVAGSRGERDGTLHERVVGVLHWRTVVKRAATLHKRAAALGVMHEWAALHVRAEVETLYSLKYLGWLCEHVKLDATIQ